MPDNAPGTVLRALRGSLLPQEQAVLTDGELLECFVNRRDGAAFATLVRRHGPMVLGVCRRVLRDEADAEDAFQATFLILVRKAASIRPPSMVGNWLYGVAHTTALKARAMNAKRATKEKAAAAVPRSEDTTSGSEQLLALLDQELKALPDIYRAAIVLCDIEGKSIKEGAAQLGCPPGTVGTRLARGRRLLAQRLSRRGLAVSGALLATAIADNAVAAVPPALTNSTIEAATLIAAGDAVRGVVSAEVAALTEGVMKTMFLTKLKIPTALGLMALLASASGVLVGWTPSSAGQDAAAPNATASAEGGARNEGRDKSLVPSLEQKVASILPSADEDRWLQIPWRVNIMEARAEALRQNKPVFLWVQDSNPLGRC
jgi:RNA polymerase sigma factor (sigma-70 family)